MKCAKLMMVLAIVAVMGMVMAEVAEAITARFVRVVHNQSPDTRFHLGEMEVFTNGTVPDDLGGGTFGGLTTSTNDHLDAAMTAYNVGALHPTVGTTSTLEHGLANRDPDNAMQGGGSVWSTANGQGVFSQYTLDLGSEVDVTGIRMWPRADGCCTSRWRNLEVELFDDNGGAPGSLVYNSGLIQPGGNVPQGLTIEMAPTGSGVPEPATLGLLAMGVVGLAGSRRRRNRIA